jgi:ABC-type glycerol-3-phosphate transport system substrate-binding protein
MKNMRPFQIALLAVFAFLAVLAIIFLSAFQAGRNEEEFKYGERVVIWGTLSESKFTSVLQTITASDDAFHVVEYFQIPEETFDSELVNAIAEGRTPDLIVLKSDALVTHRAKLYPISYENYSRRDFQDTFVDGGEMFALSEGIYGFPFAIDPMVMYWNRDMFASNGLAQAPVSWEAIVGDVVPRLTIKDTNRNVLQSAVSFGEFRNVAHAKEMLMLLALQSGSQMVTTEEKDYNVNLNIPIVEGSRAPLEAALQFYTDFSNVNSPLYSWNRSLPVDTQAFLAGDLGLYFGPGSEISDIEGKNPNLNFDVAVVPQGVGATARRTYADFYAFAIPRATRNAQGAFAVSRVLTSAQNAQLLASSFDMSSARRDNISSGDDDLYRKIIIESALIARSWYDPNAKESSSVLMQMVEDVVSNRSRIGEAVEDAVSRLTLIY